MKKILLMLAKQINHLHQSLFTVSVDSSVLYHLETLNNTPSDLYRSYIPKNTQRQYVKS